MADVTPHVVVGSAAETEKQSAEQQTSSSLDRKAMLKEKCNRMKSEIRQNKQQQLAIDEETIDKFSGFRIKGRCCRKEKWETCTLKKTLVPFCSLRDLTAAAQDQVVVGVLYAPPSAPKLSPRGEKIAEWALTDLHRTAPQQAMLILVGRAMEHWACEDGIGHSSITVGSILAVLNPKATGRMNTIRVSAEGQLLKLGSCPALGLCPAKGPQGLPCRMPYNKEGDCGYCSFHANASPCARQAQGYAPVVINRCAATSKRLRDGPSPARAKTTTAFLTTKAVAVAGDISLTFATLRDHLVAAEHALAKLGSAASTSPNTADLLEALRTLEGDELTDAALRGWEALYDQIGVVASRSDAVGEAAKRFRRKWRNAKLESGATDKGSCASALPVKRLCVREGRQGAR